MVIRDADVVREARRWTTRERGPVVDDLEQLVRADLTAFVTDALRVGAHALSATGQAQESQPLKRMFDEVAQRTIASTTQATEATGQVARQAAERSPRRPRKPNRPSPRWTRGPGRSSPTP
jgi:hypothetical protein